MNVLDLVVQYKQHFLKGRESMPHALNAPLLDGVYVLPFTLRMVSAPQWGHMILPNSRS